jgi:hypothetical protein
MVTIMVAMLLTLRQILAALRVMIGLLLGLAVASLPLLRHTKTAVPTQHSTPNGPLRRV